MLNLKEEEDRKRIEGMLNLHFFTYTITKEEKERKFDEAKANYFEKYGVPFERKD